jgi:hypothetical protein
MVIIDKFLKVMAMELFTPRIEGSKPVVKRAYHNSYAQYEVLVEL